MSVVSDPVIYCQKSDHLWMCKNERYGETEMISYEINA